MNAPRTIQVPASGWLAEHRTKRTAGSVYFDFLAASDLGEGRIGVVTHLMAADASDRVFIRTEIGQGESLDSIAAIFPAADWHEREAFELLGIVFAGHPDLRPLITTGTGNPLRRPEPLRPRLDQPWPGSHEPGADPGTVRKRRATTVPGIPAEWTRQ